MTITDSRTTTPTTTPVLQSHWGQGETSSVAAMYMYITWSKVTVCQIDSFINSLSIIQIVSIPPLVGTSQQYSPPVSGSAPLLSCRLILLSPRLTYNTPSVMTTDPLGWYQFPPSLSQQFRRLVRQTRPPSSPTEDRLVSGRPDK